MQKVGTLKLGPQWRNCDSDEEIDTLKLRPWWRNGDSVEEIGTMKMGPLWSSWDSNEEIRTMMKRKKLRLWNWDPDEEIGTLRKKVGLIWRNWDSDEEIGTLMKTHPAVIYLSVRSRLPPPLMIIALAAGSSLCLDWYASFRVSLRFCAVVQLHLSWCIPYIYKIVQEGSNLNQLPNEVIYVLYSVSFSSVINFGPSHPVLG